MKKRMIYRILSLVLSAVLTVGSVDMAVFADEINITETVAGTSYEHEKTMDELEDNTEKASPKENNSPIATESPTLTEIPVVTKTPVETEMPSETESPSETETPTPSYRPEESEKTSTTPSALEGDLEEDKEKATPSMLPSVSEIPSATPIVSAQLNDDLFDDTSNEVETESTYTLNYSINKDGVTATITGYSGDLTGDLIIPEMIDGYTVTAIGNNAFENNWFFCWEVSIPDSVTYIGDYAFYGLERVSGELHIPDSVTYIGKYAFTRCSFEGELILPTSINRIEDGAFCGCRNLSGELYIPDSVTYIGEGAFSGCDRLSGDLYIPDSVTYIGGSAFSDCRGFDGKLHIPKSIKHIYSMTFCDCYNMSGELILPDNLISIDENAFSGCVGLTGKLVLPETLEIIGKSAFARCSNFTGNLLIPNSVTNIGEYAFSCCRGFTGDLTIPESVSVLGSRAFEYCDGFDGCLTISRKNINSNYGDYCFAGCANLKKVINVSVDYSVYLNKLHCPDSHYCYDAVYWIQYGHPDIYIGSITDGIAIRLNPYSDFDFSYTIENGVLTVYGEGEMPNFTSLCRAPWYDEKDTINSVYIAEGITSVSTYMFYNLINLTDIHIAKSVTKIDNYAFADCKKIKHIDIPTTVLSVGHSAFANCYQLDIINYYGDRLTAKETGIDKYLNNIADMSDINIVYHDMNGYYFSAELSNGYAPIVYKKSFFENATSYKYDHDLARYASALSTIVYAGKNTIAKDFQAMGFDNDISASKFIDKHFFDDMSLKSATGHKCYEGDIHGLYSPVWIVHKNIYSDGEPYTLIYVVIRGTSQTEWIDNFDSGTGVFHEGFLRAAKEIAKELNTYINENDDITSNIKLLVTGHSRGAAVANILGSLIDDDELPLLTILDKSNVFVYTFATPNVTSYNHREDEKYGNIYNIINPEDFVTKVMPSKWKYGRFGINYILPSYGITSRDSFDYDNFKSTVSTCFNDYRGDVYEPYSKGMKAVTGYVNVVTREIKDVESYYNQCLFYSKYDSTYLAERTKKQSEIHSLFDLYTKTLGYYKSGSEYADNGLSNFIYAATGTWGNLGDSTASFFITHQKISKDFENAHLPETYLAMMNTISSEDLILSPKKYKGVIINCPVDVVVKNSQGCIISKIDNNNVVIESIPTDVNVDSKSIMIPDDEDITIELVGSDEGSMDYTVIEYDADLGELSRSVFTDVPLEEGCRYEQNINTSNAINNIQLISETGQIIPPNGYFEGDELGKLSLNITVVGKGMASGYESLSPGDYVLLNAYVADKYNQFLGWYDTEGNLLSSETEYGISVTENVEIEARFTDNERPEGLWMAEITNPDSEDGNYFYIGKAIIPEIKVYDNDTELVLNKDYTVSFKNNTNAYTLTEDDEGFNFAKAPTVTVTGKGNYSGKIVKTFTINPLDINECEAPDIDVLENGREQKSAPKVTNVLNGKTVTLKNNTDYKIEYTSEEEGAYVYKGVYDIVIKGYGNYAGTKTIKETISRDKTLISKVTVKPIPVQDYSGGEVTPSLTVLNGKNPLELNTDYEVTYDNNVSVGTAKAIIKGIGDYTGTRIVNFNIVGTNISKAVVTYNLSEDYTGNAVKPAVTVTLKAVNGNPEKILEEDKHYTVEWTNNTKAGTGNIIITGINGYSGTIKKTFKITPFDMTDVSNERVSTSLTETAVYTKGGSMPKVLVKDGEKELVLGTDYTLSYENNKNVSDGMTGNKLPKVKITGKGNYKGIRTITFPIKNSSSGNITMTATDFAVTGKPGIKTTVTLTDTDGKKLTAGMDYESAIKYEYEDGTALDPKTDIITVETKMRVVVTIPSKSPYYNVDGVNTISANFRCVGQDISKATIKIATQTYTGSAITLSPADISIAFGKNPPLNETDYEIVGYTNNTNKGSAKVTLKGVDDYGGMKTVSFTISQKSMSYTITYDKNADDATGTMRVSSIQTGTKLTKNAYKRPGYSFVGWNTKPDGSGKSYNDGETFRLKSIFQMFGTKEVLYAQWKEID